MSIEYLLLLREKIDNPEAKKGYGVCEITGIPIEDENDFENHHIIPKKYGGSDSFSNRIVAKKAVHRLIHANSDDVIRKLALRAGVKKEMLQSINYYRKLAHRKTITIEQISVPVTDEMLNAA